MKCRPNTVMSNPSLFSSVLHIAYEDRRRGTAKQCLLDTLCFIGISGSILRKAVVKRYFRWKMMQKYTFACWRRHNWSVVAHVNIDWYMMFLRVWTPFGISIWFPFDSLFSLLVVNYTHFIIAVDGLSTNGANSAMLFSSAFRMYRALYNFQSHFFIRFCSGSIQLN